MQEKVMRVNQGRNLYKDHIIRKMDMPLDRPKGENMSLIDADEIAPIGCQLRRMEEGQTIKAPKIREKQSVNCDQVAWIFDSLERFLKVNNLDFPGISRIKNLSKTSFLLELMEILNLKLEDKFAANNALGIRELIDCFKDQKIEQEKGSYCK